MPQYNRRELDARAREYGFNRDTFEKVSDTLPNGGDHTAVLLQDAEYTRGESI